MVSARVLLLSVPHSLPFSPPEKLPYASKVTANDDDDLIMIAKQWKKEPVWPFFGCCTADSRTDAGRHQLNNNSSLVLFSTA